ncbi:Oidioi.mRNA.OKI2018_I69.chr2.g5807.t1.cds [Oikopleura dioica]|uniref:Oidioi.mRNA.OKI2018_I69.chr2.g5807.t1.cds n=1 Tax=Oikopleura dioica TaxID=34765 RepID=A0ABN7T5U7_OIKDI|nr:Oidioi.mRNA.OKI2018_I69.chr2.g5807.t1.cds [Oikopleura dioica]
MDLDDSGFISPQQKEEALETKNSKIDENKNSSFLSLTPARDVKVCFPTRRSRRAKRRSENLIEPAHLLTKSPKKIEGQLQALKSPTKTESKKESLGDLANKVGRNPEIVKVILSSMSVQDQLKCSWVSKTWRKEVELSCKPVASYKIQLKENFEFAEMNKENSPNSSRSSRNSSQNSSLNLENDGSLNSTPPLPEKSPKKKEEQVLTPVENNLPRTSPSTPKKLADTSLSPVSRMLLNKPSANKGKDMTEIEVRAKMEDGDSIVKCPFCFHPCRKTPKTKGNRGICYNSQCLREFCGTCRKQHSSKETCCVASKSVRRLFNSPEDKSKTTVRRL